MDSEKAVTEIFLRPGSFSKTLDIPQNTSCYTLLLPVSSIILFFLIRNVFVVWLILNNCTSVILMEMFCGYFDMMYIFLKHNYYYIMESNCGPEKAGKICETCQLGMPLDRDILFFSTNILPMNVLQRGFYDF